ncbi:MAG: MBL fold metallo-hydrolase [Anaerovoracaceae bacterium]|jgi:ribonuclease BN (tRNA processing enzyme)
MKLSFMGNGSAFAETHNNAYFRHKDMLFIIDLSMMNFLKAKQLATDADEVYILVTHMHDDHVSGIPLFCQWWDHLGRKRTFNIAVPEILREDMTEELRIKGVSPELYRLITFDKNGTTAPGDPDDDLYEASAAHIEHLVDRAIPTAHAKALSGKCFGYRLQIGDTGLIYTGDTNTLEPFLPAIQDGDELYIETADQDVPPHLYWETAKDQITALAKTHPCYLMHQDDAKSMQNKLRGLKVRVAPIDTEEE